MCYNTACSECVTCLQAQTLAYVYSVHMCVHLIFQESHFLFQISEMRNGNMEESHCRFGQLLVLDF